MGAVVSACLVGGNEKSEVVVFCLGFGRGRNLHFTMKNIRHIILLREQ
jgi:hypothetical protein